MITPLTGMV